MTEMRAPEVGGSNGHRGPTRTVGSVAPTLSRAALVPRRRLRLTALGLSMAALGGVGFAVMLANAGHRVPVLVVAKNVRLGAVLTASDLEVAHVSVDGLVTPVRARDERSVIGKVAAVDLVAGSLLVPSELTASVGLASGEQLIGVPVRPGQMPSRSLVAGMQVALVGTPGDYNGSVGGSGAGTAAPLYSGLTVVDVGKPTVDGTTVVDLIVPAQIGPQVAALASTGRVALVIEPQPAG